MDNNTRAGEDGDPCTLGGPLHTVGTMEEVFKDLL